MDSYHSLKEHFFAKMTEKMKSFFEQSPVRSNQYLVEYDSYVNFNKLHSLAANPSQTNQSYWS